MLVEAAIGDAYGGGFEFVDEEIVRKYNGIFQYRAHPKHVEITPGKYTDDTQMALSICEAMLENDPWTPESLAQRFVNGFKRDPRTGYSRRLYSILTTVADGPELLAKIDGNSDKSGAAMRAFPIGLISNVSTLLDRAEIQAKITHHNPLGIVAAQASALMTHYFCYRKGDPSGLAAYIAAHVDAPEGMPGWDKPYSGKVLHQGWMSVAAAITAITEVYDEGEPDSDDGTLSDILFRCIDFTGDVDTVATIALAAASFSDHFFPDLPINLLVDLEGGTYGRDYIINLDKQLMSRVKRPDHE